jgi:thioester reductase-like protein
MINEDQTPASDRVTEDGYGRSKYVAERLIANARNDGVSSVVYRLGEVWPHRELGVSNPTSVTHNLLYACVRTGCVFDTAAAIDITPVDVVSRFVAQCVSGEVQIPDGTVHVMWRATVRFADIFAELAERGGLDRVSYSEFRRRLGILAEPPEPDEQLMRLRLVLPPGDIDEAAPAEFDEMFTASGLYFNADRFEEHAALIPDPPDNPVDALDRYLTSLVTTPSPDITFTATSAARGEAP